VNEDAEWYKISREESGTHNSKREERRKDCFLVKHLIKTHTVLCFLSLVSTLQKRGKIKTQNNKRSSSQERLSTLPREK
jgi:hypothetical protein